MKTPKTTEEMIEEMAQVYREKIKLEAFYKTDIGHALDLTKTRDLVSEALTQLANQIHTQSALEAEGRKESVRDCGRCNNCETAVSTCEIIIDANGFNKACEADATYHRSKVIE